MKQQQIDLKIEGMTCTNCANLVRRSLERKGMQNVNINFAAGELSFVNVPQMEVVEIKKGIEKLGFSIIENDTPKPFFSLERKLILAAFFTFPLLFHHLFMMFGWSPFSFFDQNYWLQFLVCLPVFVLGCWHFGASAYHSVKNGLPNMDVLIFIGSTSAFVYSFIGTILQQHQYIFYETCATIITLVLFGNWLEKTASARTGSAIDALSRLEVTTATKILPNGELLSVPKATLHEGDLLQVNEGDAIPADGRVEAGEGEVNESMLTGESMPIVKQVGDVVVGASLLVRGSLRLRVTAVGSRSTLQRIIQLVRDAQSEKPNIQRLADRASAIFVPLVLGIALLTFVCWYFFLGATAHQAIMNAIAVMVISCPCALGLATPTAIIVGIGRAAREGILIRGGQTLEQFAHTKVVVFDKTGTLTSGNFALTGLEILSEDISELEVKRAIISLEQHSSHPIAKSLVKTLRESDPALATNTIALSEVVEHKGLGIEASDASGNFYQIGSYKMFYAKDENDFKNKNDLYFFKNEKLAAVLDISDEVTEEVINSINVLKEMEIKPVILSGDRAFKVEATAKMLGITESYADKLPSEKLDIIKFYKEQMPTAMVGDGINDAPALAAADVGVSLANASQVAIQSAGIVLLQGRVAQLPNAIRIARLTLMTIKQNIAWAFVYNIVAIPLAAAGGLNPMWGALFMAFSDVVVIGNSLRINYFYNIKK